MPYFGLCRDQTVPPQTSLRQNKRFTHLRGVLSDDTANRARGDGRVRF
jgi:hypothetical protein